MSGTAVRLVVLWLVVALLLWLAARLPVDQMVLNVGRAIALICLVLYTLRTVGLL